MSNYKDYKVSFFFGAGAEVGDNNLAMPSGPLFFRQSLLIDSIKEDGEIFYEKDTFTKTLSSVFKKSTKKKKSHFNYGCTCLTSSDSIYKYIIREGLEKISEQEAKYYEKYIAKDSKDNKEVVYTICEDFKDKVEQRIKNRVEVEVAKNKDKNVQKDNNSNNRSNEPDLDNFIDFIYEKNHSLAGYMERYFHCIIDPSKYSSKNFAKIFNYYWAAFFSIVSAILSDKNDIFKHNNKSLDKYKSAPNRCITKLFNITTTHNVKSQNVDHFINFIKDLYNADIDLDKVQNTYYGQIRHQLIELKQTEPLLKVSGVITTNYFNFAEQIIGTKMFDDYINYSYPNGQLKYFEFPEKLEVKDFANDEIDSEYLDSMFFPFIFGQSYIKPIVHQAQIEQLNMMNTILQDTNRLIILGYGMNDDDNHINAYLHNYLMKPNNKIIKVESKTKVNEKGEKYFITSILDNLHFSKLTESAETIERLKNQIIIKTYDDTKDKNDPKYCSIDDLFDEIFD